MPSVSKEKNLRCALCEGTIRKGEQIAMIEKEKDWCKYAFEKKLITLCVHNSCRTRISKEMRIHTDESDNETEDNATCDVTVQTEPIEILQVLQPFQPLTAIDEENESTTKHSTSQLFTPNVSSYDNFVQLPFRRLRSAKSRCCVCHKYFSKSKSSSSLIKQSMRSNMLLTYNIITDGSTCCKKHLQDDEFKSNAIDMMKRGPDTCKITVHELLQLIKDIQISFIQLQSLLSEALLRPSIDFDDIQIASSQYFVLTGISKENFDNLCSHIPAASLRQTDLRSTRQSIGCLLVKLRLGLSNQILATFFCLPNKRAVSRIVDSACTALMEHFVLKYLGFGHLSRRDLIDSHTRSLAKRLFTQAGGDKAIVILDGTYLYVQKSSNNLLQRRTYSLHKGRARIKLTMFVSTDGYIISEIGPYLADSKNNDVAMTKHIFLTNSEAVNDWFQPNDLPIVD